MKIKSILLSAASLCLAATFVQAKVRVVATTEDLAALTREVGGDLVEVRSIAKGYQDPHFVEAKPSYLLGLKRADLFIQVGLELETAWAPALLTGSRNPKILPGGPGFLDASGGCEILQKVAGGVDRSMGDIHPLGNPHYWLDPSNGRAIASNVAEKLSALDPGHAAGYRANLEHFRSRLAEKEMEWDETASVIRGVKAVTYHDSWPNFAGRFGIEVVGYIEPKPGVPPSPAHVRDLIGLIRSQKVPVILVEPYFDLKLPEKIAREAGARLLVFPPSVGAEPGIRAYFDLFDRLLGLLRGAVAAGEANP